MHAVCNVSTRLGRFCTGTASKLLPLTSLTGLRKQTFDGLVQRICSSFFSTSTVREKKMTSKKFEIAKRIQGTEKNVWVDISKLAVQQKSVNLGQGFPDFMAPEHVVQCLKDAVCSDTPGVHQYTRSFGHPRLVNALAQLYEPIFGRQIDPMTEILISIGGYGSLFSIIQGLVNPGDEVIIIEPFFDCYMPMVKAACGVPVFVPLRPTVAGQVMSSADWKLDESELSSKFNSKTKLIILNTPNNPLGKVFKKEELQVIADLCKKHDVVCIADEVYEWMTYDDNRHVRIATLPDMWERTVTIGSAGKTFSVTGWKLGWTIGPKHLVHCAQIMHQNCAYTCPTPMQEAVARGLQVEISRLGTPESYLTSLAKELQPKRDYLASVLAEVGMKPVVPQGGYFMMADYSNLVSDLPESDEAKDFRFVKWMTINKKLTVIPPTAFYSKEHEHMVDNYVRFCFIKKDSTLQQAAQILKHWND